MVAVLDEFSLNLMDIVKREKYNYSLFILPFGFSFDDREKESHYLLFITKNHKAVSEMKKIMNKLATSIGDIYSYDTKKVNQIPLFDLETDAYINFKKTIEYFKTYIIGKKWTLPGFLMYIDELSMKRFHKVTPFTPKDSRQFLRKLYDEGIIKSGKAFSAREIFSDSREFCIESV